MKKSIRVIFVLLGLSLLPLTHKAHTVQWAYCKGCNTVTIYTEHWHGAVSVLSLDMIFDITINGVTSRDTLNPVANHQNIPVAQLQCTDSLQIMAGCPGRANTYNDWFEFQIPGVSCGDTVSVTIVAGRYAASADGCNMLPLTSQTFVIPCDSVTTPVTIPNQTVCEGDSFSSVVFPPFTGTTYSWTNTDTTIGLHASDTGNIAGFPSSMVNGNTTSTVTAHYGCRSTSFTLTVLNGPTPKFGVRPFCLGDTVHLWDSSYTNVVSWQWDYGNNNSVDDSVQNPIYTGPSGPQFIKLSVTDSAGCSNHRIDSVVISSQPQPVASISSADSVCVNSPFNLINTSVVGSPASIVSWDWDILDNNVIDYTTQNASHTFPTPGSYTIQTIVTTGDGCKDSTSKVVHAVTCTGINEFNASTISTWPNPSNDVIHITFDQSTTQQATAQILDMSGRLISEEQIYAGITNNIDVSALASGVYLLRLTSEGQQYAQPVHISE